MGGKKKSTGWGTCPRARRDGPQRSRRERPSSAFRVKEERSKVGELSAGGVRGSVDKKRTSEVKENDC